jgi:prephenate dehydrogenase
LATPVLQIESLLADLVDGFSSGTIVTDVGSTKRGILAVASRLSVDVDFIGGHPMAGKATSGIEEADGDLFRGASWALVPRDGTRNAAIESISDFIRDLGARPILTKPDLHDRAVAIVSHVPQILSLLLCEQAAAAENALDLAGPTFRGLARLADSPYGIWREILASNRDQVSGALLELADRIKKAEQELATEGLEEHFRNAKQAVKGP